MVPLLVHSLHLTISSQTDCQISCYPGFVVNGSKTSCRFGTFIETQRCLPGSCIVTAPLMVHLVIVQVLYDLVCNCQLGCNNPSALTGQGQAPTCDGTMLSYNILWSYLVSISC